jgi:hypothetical protein
MFRYLCDSKTALMDVQLRFTPLAESRTVPVTADTAQADSLGSPGPQRLLLPKSALGSKASARPLNRATGSDRPFMGPPGRSDRDRGLAGLLVRGNLPLAVHPSWGPEPLLAISSGTQNCSALYASSRCFSFNSSKLNTVGTARRCSVPRTFTFLLQKEYAGSSIHRSIASACPSLFQQPGSLLRSQFGTSDFVHRASRSFSSSVAKVSSR